MNVTVDELELFALLLGAPESESLALLEAMAEAHPWLGAALEELRALPLERWQGAHTALFLNGYPNTPAPPFLSAFCHGQMGGGLEEELQAFYQRLGLEPNAMPADYLGTLFECAAWLMTQGRTHAADLDELWRRYLLTMLPDFSQRLSAQGGLQLYQALGRELDRLCTRVSSGMQATA